MRDRDWALPLPHMDSMVSLVSVVPPAMIDQEVHHILRAYFPTSKVGWIPPSIAGLTVAQAAEFMNVSVESVRKAALILADGDAKTIARIDAGGSWASSAHGP